MSIDIDTLSIAPFSEFLIATALENSAKERISSLSIEGVLCQNFTSEEDVMKKFASSGIAFLLLALFVVTGVVVSMTSAVAQEVRTCSWAQLKGSAGEGDNVTLAKYTPGQDVLFIVAYEAKPRCAVAKTVPAEFDCTSVLDPSTKRWFDQSAIAAGDPQYEVLYGDGKARCNGRLVPEGQYWGMNKRFREGNR